MEIGIGRKQCSFKSSWGSSRITWKSRRTGKLDSCDERFV